MPCATASRQRGESLISLMVGLLLSTVVALAMLSMFKVSTRYGGQAGQDAAADGQLTAALMRASLAVQDAGFGIASASLGTQLVVLSGAALGGTALSGSAVATGSSGNAVLWAMNTTGTAQCAGLLFDASTSGTGGLYYLGPVACSAGSVSGWSSLAWTATRWADRPANQAAAAYNQTAIGFSVASTACKPFGLTASSGNVVWTLASTNRSAAPLTEQQCLFNFKAP